MTVRFWLISIITILFSNMSNTCHGQIRLKEQVEIVGPVIRLKDIFDGIRDRVLAGEEVGNSPKPGKSYIFKNEWLEQTAHYYGLDWSGDNVTQVIVTRASHNISRGDIEGLILNAFSKTNDSLRIYKVNFDRFTPFKVAANTKLNPRVENISWHGNNHFYAKIKVGSIVKHFSGRVQAHIELPVLNTQIVKGQIIKRSHITYQLIPENNVGGNVVVNPDLLIGRTAKRIMLPAMRAVNVNDLDLPVIVKKNQKVLVVVKRPGLTVSMRGIAQSEAKIGDQVGVLNPKSKVVVMGTVVSPGIVRMI